MVGTDVASIGATGGITGRSIGSVCGRAGAPSTPSIAPMVDSTQDATDRAVQRAERLRELHRPGEPLVLVNVWDVLLVLNARTDVVARGGEVDDAVRRGLAYLGAGAECVFVLGVHDLPDIRRLADAFEGRLNVLGRPGMPSIAELADAGVCRVSIGSSGPGIAYAAFGRAAAQLLAGGDYLPEQALVLPTGDHDAQDDAAELPTGR